MWEHLARLGSPNPLVRDDSIRMLGLFARDQKTLTPGFAKTYYDLLSGMLKVETNRSVRASTKWAILHMRRHLG